MSMFVGMDEVTISNYKELFNWCSPDVLDEIRSAIWDGVDISDYIEVCRDDSYRLGQIRLALREGMPLVLLSGGVSGKAIHSLRWCFAKGIKLEPLLKYYGKVDAELLGKLIEATRLGANIESVNFMNIKRDIIDIVISGLINQYPMEMCEGNKDWMTEDYVRTLIRGMAMGVDVLVFAESKWNIDIMNSIFSQSCQADINTLLMYITNRFNFDLVQQLLGALKEGQSLDILAKKYDDGSPVYNEYQVEVLREALSLGIGVRNKIFKPDLSDVQMRKILDKLTKK